MPWETQAIYFMKPKFDEKSAEAWIKGHKLKPIKAMHAVGNEMRYRLEDPKKYREFKTKVLPSGVHLVLGHPKRLAFPS